MLLLHLCLLLVSSISYSTALIPVFHLLSYSSVITCVCNIFFVLHAAPILGWGRYQTFEFGCTVAFHDSNPLVRSYVVTLFLIVFFIPLGNVISLYISMCSLFKQNLTLIYNFCNYSSIILCFLLSFMHCQLHKNHNLFLSD